MRKLTETGQTILAVVASAVLIAVLILAVQWIDKDGTYQSPAGAVVLEFRTAKEAAEFFDLYKFGLENGDAEGRGTFNRAVLLDHGHERDAVDLRAARDANVTPVRRKD